ncbi:glycine--tRNA ligase [Lapillicoccus sp.]|uniref:glycine--tRNA ligase n=1 Tax=Lapillicoccus sp. TaxID=1909287 RepID=UPI0039C95D5F
MAKQTSIVDTVVSLCKRRGFVFPSGEIYGGTRSAWDYGPLGVELKENIRRQWWKAMVTSRDDVVGLDSSIILPRETWVASGHVGTFTDPLVECLNCHKRRRQDHLQEALAEKKGIADPDSVPMTDIVCPDCGTKGRWTEPRDFQMMLKTYLGVIEDESGLHYLRPETAQGIFVNFLNVMQASRKKPPFGIAQTGKSFRNEITPGNFIFRTREFEQMEMEFFVKPGDDAEWHQYWIDERTRWYTDLGINPENLRHYEHAPEKLSHYSTRTVDIEYRFRFAGSEWGELEGIANRTDFDLSTHSKHSGTDLQFFDQTTGEKYTPYVIEPAAGLSRSLMTFLVDAYAEDEAWHQKWIDDRTAWYVGLGINPDNLRHFEHPKEKLSHYSKRTVDIEYRFNFTGSEWGELEGIANRTDFDLTTHSQHSGTELVYFDQTTGERYTPYVIEPAAGLSRSLMTFLVDAYAEDEAPNTKGGVDKRVVLRLDPRLAPVKAAVLPLSRNADLSPKARDLAAQLRQHWNIDFDDAGAIGKRYRRHDEIGTPYCVTVDFDTLEDQAVTIRERDSMAQERIALDQVEGWLAQRLVGC